MRSATKSTLQRAVVSSILLSALLFPSVSSAFASKTVLQLANDPASVFDIGLIRLESYMTRFWQIVLSGSKEVRHVSCAVDYDFMSNRITVSVIVGVDGEFTVDQLKNLATTYYIFQPPEDIGCSRMFQTSGQRSLESADISYDEIPSLIWYDFRVMSDKLRTARLTWNFVNRDFKFVE